ncbi:hypothetical protein [Hyphomicrobium sp.]|uniref:hypothetical protein n=1 Tax=Hyphomicrobium sp. TaxID=82 RepID=UPI001D70C953|nr:hypothetical protein [Hyphomicrobium sp.]MBY0560591.1 hypothetical protein [Hyphomicrobium sp.]
MKRTLALLPVAVALMTFGGMAEAKADFAVGNKINRGVSSVQQVRDGGYYEGRRPWWRHERRWGSRDDGWRRNWRGYNRFDRDRDRYGWNDRRDWRGDSRWR